MFALCLIALIITSVWFVINTLVMIGEDGTPGAIAFMQEIPLAFVIVVLSICVGSL